MGSTPTFGAAFELVTFSSFTGLTGSNFSAINLGAGGHFGTGQFTLNPTNLTWTAVPEASNLLIGGLLGLGMMSRRRKQA
jgi:hypothetical protein